MGDHNVETGRDPEALRIFMQQVLDDAQALELLLERGAFETGIRRIGAEQEIFLVEPETMRPSLLGMEVLAAIDDPHYTTELGRFNLECNLDPQVLGPGCFDAMEAQLREMLDLGRRSAREVGAEVLLVGILPTLQKADLTLDNMAPIPRYFALAETMRTLRGREFDFHIKGRDELKVRHDSVMFEACNTSFQVHLQTTPDEFARLYNLAQLITAPCLSIACFSPLLFGRRLWSETRIALFQQAVDTRRGNSHHRQQRPRVSFGDRWVDDSVLDIFREDIAAFRLLLTTELSGSSLAQLERGEIPDLKALRLHNGTVYRWNRPCYGFSGDQPHLRIENRVLPSGPTVADEMANTALWIGALGSLLDTVGDVRELVPFDVVKENFTAAARLGMQAQFRWIDGRQHTAQDLVLDEMVPRARDGLAGFGVSREEIDRHLGVIEERARSLRTGSRWILDSLASMDEVGRPAERLAEVTAAVLEHQQTSRPVHEWPLATLRRESGVWQRHVAKVGNLMSTSLFTVGPDEVVDLVAALMDWQYIHHVPVEDEEHRLVGLLTHRRLLRHLARHQGRDRRPVPVREIMETELVTAEPSTTSLEAIRRMKTHRIACLPVVENDRLVGIVTEHDFLRVADKLLEDFLQES
ncbi:MAG: CBS domain-containing protein [Acidobacteriota bacterium]